MTKCYIGGKEGEYLIARYKTIGFNEVECEQEDIDCFSKIKHGHIEEIQSKIHYILYKAQLELNFNEKNTQD